MVVTESGTIDTLAVDFHVVCRTVVIAVELEKLDFHVEPQYYRLMNNCLQQNNDEEPMRDNEEIKLTVFLRFNQNNALYIHCTI